MDSLLILTIAISLVTVLANLAVGFGEDSRDGFGWDTPTGLS
jgi:hypothetical protein